MDKKEFEMQKELEMVKFEQMEKIELLRQRIAQEQHEGRMEELKYFRGTENLKHQNEMERQRIKTAEIRKADERRALRESGQRPPRY